MKLTRPLVTLDLETTGTWIEKDRIIEIGMVRLSLDGKKDVYVKKINPLMPIPAAVTELTGIKDEDVAGAPKFKMIAPEVLSYLNDADLAGFNIERFDLPLLSREFRDAGLSFDTSGRNIYDAQKIYHLHERRDLAAAYDFYCQKKLDGAHSALMDSEAALDILQEQLHRYVSESDQIEGLLNFNYRPKEEFFDKERRFRWWNGELYMLFGKYARQEPLNVIARTDPQYLEWMLKKDFSDDVKSMISGVLRGAFPKPPQ